jgi:hypothetical protein
MHFLCAGVAVVHLVQAVLYFSLGRARGYFTIGALLKFGLLFGTPLLTLPISGKFLFNFFVPVIGWAVWFCGRSDQTVLRAQQAPPTIASARADFATGRVEMMEVSCLMC